ncbi:MAG: lipoyl protein ligase domain-containing protein [Acidimicrobiales bacterium]
MPRQGHWFCEGLRRDRVAVEMTLPVYLPEDRSGVLPIAYFHALARLGLEGLVLVEPEASFVSVGFFDDAAAAVDLEGCLRRDLPVIRREVGGGPVLLGPGQVFYNLILARSHPLIPARLEDAYRLLSQPAIEVYRHFGVNVHYQPINDLVTSESKKVAGQGAADIGDTFCFVGAILRYFDTALMSEVLRVPEEKMRGKLFALLSENMSTIEAETGAAPGTQATIDALVTAFSRLLGPLEPRPVPEEANALARQLGRRFCSPEVVLASTPRRHTAIRVREGVYLRQGSHKARGGLLRAEVATLDGVIVDLALSGDCTFLPKDVFRLMAGALVGARFEPAAVAHAVEEFLVLHEVDCPGIDAADFAQAITGKCPLSRISPG